MSQVLHAVRGMRQSMSSMGRTRAQAAFAAAMAPSLREVALAVHDVLEVIPMSIWPSECSGPTSGRRWWRMVRLVEGSEVS